MAIKIIKPGKKPDTTKRFECSYRGCVFDADKDDYGLVGDAYGNQWAYMTCPTCGHKVYRLRDE